MRILKISGLALLLMCFSIGMNARQTAADQAQQGASNTAGQAQNSASSTGNKVKEGAQSGYNKSKDAVKSVFGSHDQDQQNQQSGAAAGNAGAEQNQNQQPGAAAGNAGSEQQNATGAQGNEAGGAAGGQAGGQASGQHGNLPQTASPLPLLGLLGLGSLGFGVWKARYLGK